MGDKRKISEINPNEWSDLVVFINKKVLDGVLIWVM